MFFGHYEKALKEMQHTWKWSVTNVSADTDGEGPNELRACLTEGWEPFAVDGGRIYLRRKVAT